MEKIIHLVEHAEAATARLADRYAAWFVPIVIVLAVGTWVFTREVEQALPYGTPVFGELEQEGTQKQTGE